MMDNELCCRMSCMYAIVFSKENSVAVVPTSWLDGDTCFWPPFKLQDRIDRAVKNADLPHKSWSRHPVKILGIKGECCIMLLL